MVMRHFRSAIIEHAVSAARCALRLRGPSSHVKNASAMTLPTISATMKPGTSTGRMPENVSVSDRAIATAGLAKEVEAVNQ